MEECMKDKERIKKFIELQNKGLKLEDIALELGIAKTTLRVFLNKNGYKMYNGIYKLKDENISYCYILMILRGDAIIVIGLMTLQII